MAFESDIQALTALVEAVRENTTELRLIKIATLETRDAQLETRDALRELLAALPATMAPAMNGHAAQLDLAGALMNGARSGDPYGTGDAPAALHRATTIRCDPYGQELERGISWDPSGAVWAVGATNRERGRRRVRVPAARFPGEPAAGLAEARRVLAFLTDPSGRDARALLAAMHPDTARDVAEAMAR